MSEKETNELFVGLLFSLHSSAWMQLGKVVHPQSGKVERDLEAAKETIDLLGVLEAKTRGNLAPEEERLMTQLLLELRLNYVEESRGAKAGEAASTAAGPAGPGEPAAGGPRGTGSGEPSREPDELPT